MFPSFSSSATDRGWTETDFQICSLTTSESGLTTTCHCHVDGHDVWSVICLLLPPIKPGNPCQIHCAPRCRARNLASSIRSTPCKTEAIDRDEFEKDGTDGASSPDIVADTLDHSLQSGRYVGLILARGFGPRGQHVAPGRGAGPRLQEQFRNPVIRCYTAKGNGGRAAIHCERRVAESLGSFRALRSGIRSSPVTCHGGLSFRNVLLLPPVATRMQLL